jgi:hypothetical protein
MVSSFGGVGDSSGWTTPALFFREVEEKAIMVVCDCLVARLLVFIRNYSGNSYSKRIPPPSTMPGIKSFITIP